MSSLSEYLCLQYDNIPCWYQISFRKDIPAIVIGVHKDFVEFLPPLNNETPAVKYFMEDFKFSRFESNMMQGDFGFDGAFKRMGNDGLFIYFSAQIPVFEKYNFVPCHHCYGQKKDFFGKCPFCKESGIENKMVECRRCKGEKTQWSGSDEPCSECGGKGIKEDSFMDWQTLYAISATFSLFFELASFGQHADKMVCCKIPQLILLNTATIKDMHGGSLWGTYSIPMVNWLSSFVPNSEIREMTQAMTITWKKLFGNSSMFDDFDQMQMYARIAYKGGWLNVGCPGDACGLHPSASDITRRPTGQGYEFSCHNVDNPMQQLTLLAGLGALCDKARTQIAH